jgi:methionyl-tRNA formyltransferase
LQPWPVAETKLAGDRIKVIKTSLGTEQKAGTPGDLITDGKTSLAVLCGDGRVLLLTEIQPENRKRLAIKDFLNSYRGHFPYQRMDAHG